MDANFMSLEEIIQTSREILVVGKRKRSYWLLKEINQNILT